MEKTTQRSGAATAAKQTPETYWRSFPYFEEILKSERPPLLEKIAANCRKLDAIIKSGLSHEKQRARDAMAAYARTLELYGRLAEARDNAAAKAGNPKERAHDK
jgi:hypothetical protein